MKDYSLFATPVNVDALNPYNGVDRGAFVISSEGTSVIARVVEAIWVCKGPAQAPGVLRFKLKKYGRNIPTNLDEVLAGQDILPDEGEWFETYTRGRVHTPILAEYWAKKFSSESFNELNPEKYMPMQGELVCRLASRLFSAVFEGTPIAAMETRIHFGLDSEGALVRDEAIVEYTKKDGSKVVLEATDPVFDPSEMIRQHVYRG